MWICLWGCFLTRLAFESVDWIKITLTSVCGHCPIQLESSRTERIKQMKSLLALQHSPPPTQHWRSESWAFGLRLNYTIGFPGLQYADSGLWGSVSNSYNKSLRHVYLHILFILFLWRTWTNILEFQAEGLGWGKDTFEWKND